MSDTWDGKFLDKNAAQNQNIEMNQMFSLYKSVMKYFEFFLQVG